MKRFEIPKPAKWWWVKRMDVYVAIVFIYLPLYVSMEYQDFGKSFFQSVLSGDKYLKNTVFFFLQPAAVSVPAVKITGQIHCICAGRPFPVVPAIAYLVKTKVQMGICKVTEGLSLLQQLRLFPVVIFHTQVNISFIRRKLGIDLQTQTE